MLKHDELSALLFSAVTSPSSLLLHHQDNIINMHEESLSGFHFFVMQKYSNELLFSVGKAVA